MPDDARRSAEEDEEEEDTVPPFLLEVGSKWPAYDEHYLIRIKLTERALNEGFPTCDFQAYLSESRAGSGYPLSYGCDHDIWEECKKLDQADIPKWSALVHDRAVAQLTHIREALDFRLTSHDPLQEWELDKSLQEQEFIRQSWNLLPDPVVRDELRRATKRLLIESTDYPIVPAASLARTPRAARTSSATQSPRTPSRGNAKGKRSALPEPTDTPKPVPAIPRASPAAGPASASNPPPQVPQAAAPPVPPAAPQAAPALPVNRNRDSASLADFLSSLEPDRHFERYVSHFRRCNLDEPEQLLSFARGPSEELDALLAELGKDADGIKGMLPL
ncbi:hypothetical protein JCM10908_000167 [Rhodotorula pacifica]|uniref:uncharacterized protein n=1 Tax=Rhodotorula pacifica TaxID=1495444 RepID=UPI003179248F